MLIRSIRTRVWIACGTTIEQVRRQLSRLKLRVQDDRNTKTEIHCSSKDILDDGLKLARDSDLPIPSQPPPIPSPHPTTQPTSSPSPPTHYYTTPSPHSPPWSSCPAPHSSPRRRYRCPLARSACSPKNSRPSARNPRKGSSSWCRRRKTWRGPCSVGWW